MHESIVSCAKKESPGSLLPERMGILDFVADKAPARGQECSAAIGEAQSPGLSKKVLSLDRVQVVLTTILYSHGCIHIKHRMVYGLSERG